MTEQLQEPKKKSSSRDRAKVVLAAVLVVMFLLLISLGVFFVRVLQPATEVATDSPQPTGLTWVRSLYGFGPAADEQLLSPTAVAIAPDGTIYATDPQRSRIMAFRPDGTFKRLIHTGAGGTGRGMMLSPAGVAVDAQGNVYVGDAGNGKIIVFNTDGRPVREWAAPNVIGISVNGDRLLALQAGSVVTYSLTGEKLGQWGRAGRGFGDAMTPTYGVIGDDKAVYVADANNAAIKAFDKKGKLLWSAHTGGSKASSSTTNPAGSGNDLIQVPQSLAIDAAGRLVAVDAFSFKMLVLDRATGKILGDYGDYGTRETKFYYPTGIAYDPARDWFAVADTNNNRVQILRLSGSGGGTMQAVNRALTSPLKICAIPLIVLLIAIVILATTRPSRVKPVAREAD